MKLMKILFDADIVLEFVLNRTKFVDGVKDLHRIFETESFIQPYMSQVGINKLVGIVDVEKSEEFSREIEKTFTILRVTEAVREQARSSSAIDPESAIEVALAIQANIGAIVTHKPSDFSSEEFAVITLIELEQRCKLEINLSKNSSPAILVISNLNNAFYHSPSYIAPKPLKQKKNTHQLNPNYSSNKLSSLSGKNLSPLYIDRDRLLIKSFARSTAHVDIQSTGLITGYRAYTNPVISLKESMLHAGKAYSSLVDGLSIKPLLAQSTTYADVVKLSNLGLESLTCKSSLDVLKTSIDQSQLSVKSIARPTAYIDSIKSTGIAVARGAYENPFGEVSKFMYSSGKASSLAVEKLSIKSPALPSFAQLESSRFSGIAAIAPQAHENLLGSNLMKDILPSGKASSLAVERFSSKSPDPQSFAQLESPRFSGMAATALQTHENLLGSKVMEYIRPSGKASSLAVERLSSKSPDPQSFAQLESSRFGGIVAIAPQAYESPLDTLKERIDHSNQLNPLLKVDRSFSDRSGVLSQIKPIESMQKANTLDSYLSRKN
jgi:hypothetical protein